MRIAVVQHQITLVDVDAHLARAGPSGVARAGEGAHSISTSCTGVAVVQQLRAFIDVVTTDSVARPALIASTHE